MTFLIGIVGRAQRRLTSFLLRWADRIQLWVLDRVPKVEFKGIEIVDLEESEDEVRERIFEAIRSAITLIELVSPQQFSRVQRGIKRVIVEHAPSYSGFFCRNREAAVLHRDFVLDEHILDISRLIIHEATHGELEAKGFEYVREHRTQIERICRKRELAFMRRFISVEGIDDLDARVEALERRLGAESLPEPRLRRMYLDHSLTNLERMGLPSFITHAARRVHTWRLQRQYGLEATREALAPRGTVETSIESEEHGDV